MLWYLGRAVNTVRSFVRPKAVAAFVIAAGILLLPRLLRAQVWTASVAGVVRDSRGDIVPDAGVLLRNLETGVERPTLSNSLGNYLRFCARIRGDPHFRPLS